GERGGSAIRAGGAGAERGPARRSAQQARGLSRRAVSPAGPVRGVDGARADAPRLAPQCASRSTGAAVFPRRGAAARFASARTLACRLPLEILWAAGRRKALGADQRGEFGSHVEDDNRRRPHGTELSPWIRRSRLLHGL